MKLFIIVLANFLTVYAAIPYLREILQGKTKPRVVSWFGWGALTAVAAAAAFLQHQLPAAIFLTFCSLQNFSIALLGFKHGDRHFSALDMFCLAGAILGAATLLVLKSPVISTWIAIVTDFVVLIPTLLHTWQKPGEETVSTFILEGIASVLTLAIAGGFAFTAIAYPLYLLIADEIITILILQANRRQQLGVLGQTPVMAPLAKIPAPGSQILPGDSSNQPPQ